MNSLTLKRHNSFQNEKILKFSGICASWSYPKADLVRNFLNPENRSFENVSIVTFKQMFDIPLPNSLFIYFLNLLISLIELKTFIYLITCSLLFLTIYLFNYRTSIKRTQV